MVIRDGKVANYQPYPPTPWNANPRDTYGTPGPYEDAVQNTPIFEENGPDELQGRRHHAGGPLASTRACRAACTCTPGRARCGRWCTRRRGCAEAGMGVNGAASDPEALVARVEELTAQLEQIADPFARALRGRARGRADGPLRRGPRADLRRDRRGGVRRAARAAHRGRRGGEPDADPRPLPGAARGARAGGARQRAALHGVPRRQRRAAGHRGRVARLRLEGSCHGCAASASTLELASSRRCTRPRRISRASTSRGSSSRAAGAFELPMAGGGAPVSRVAGAGRLHAAAAGCADHRLPRS